MNRRTFIGTGLCSLTCSLAPLLAGDHDGKDKHDRKHGHEEDEPGEDEREHGRGQRGPYFRQGDQSYLQENYGGRPDLPPGLRKKYYRTGQLPPGWERRLRPFPPSVIGRLPPTPSYYDRGYLDGYAVVYDRRTRAIVDLIDLFASPSGR